MGQLPMGPSCRTAEICVKRNLQVCMAHRGREAGASCVTGYEWENPMRQVGPCVWGHREGPTQ